MIRIGFGRYYKNVLFPSLNELRIVFEPTDVL